MQNALEYGRVAAMTQPGEEAPCADEAPPISTAAMFDLVQTLQSAAKTLRVRWDRELRGGIPGMNATHAHLMVHLAEEGGVPQVRLARLAGLSEMTLTRLLDELEEVGWVRREPSPIDRRVHAIRLTIEGCNTLTTIHTNTREFVRRNFAGIDEERVRTLIAALAILK